MIVTWILSIIIFINGVISLKNSSYYLKLILHPVSIVREHQYYRLLTADFVHNDFTHLFMNEVMLVFVCGKLEKELCATYPYGELDYIILYLFSMMFSAVIVSIINQKDPSYASAGSSASILGCMFALMLLRPNLTAFYLPFVGAVKRKYDGLLFIVMLTIYQFRSKNNVINHEAHFFGAVGGTIYALLLFRPDLRLLL